MKNKNIKEQVAEGNGAQLDNQSLPEYKNTKDHTPEGEWIAHMDKEHRLNILGPEEDEGRMRQWIATVWGEKTRETNAKRIVECVNAMEGIESPRKLRETWDAIQHLELDAYEKMKAQRDELLTALEGIKKFVDNDFPTRVKLGNRSDEYTAAWKRMNDAIALVKPWMKGGQP